MGLHTYGKQLHPLLWTARQAAHGKITIRGIPKCPSYCKIVIVYTQLTNVTMGRQLETPDLSRCIELHSMRCYTENYFLIECDAMKTGIFIEDLRFPRATIMRR